VAERQGHAVLLATIGAPHGVRGEVRVKSFTAEPMSLGDYGPLAAADGRRFDIERLRPAKQVVIAKFRGIDDRDSAEALNGTELYVDREALPAAGEDEFYHADLIGLTALREAGEALGTIVAIHDFGAGDILEIAPARGPSLLVPFTRAAVPHVDMADGRVIVSAAVARGHEQQSGGDAEE
jgi:16S rRNA processing protein RimM